MHAATTTDAVAAPRWGQPCTPAVEGNVTKDRLDPCQGSNERKVTGAGMGSGCGVQRRRRRLAIVRLPIRVQCRFGLETLGRKPVDANDMQQNQTSKSLL